jgi:hypothetical protein
MVERKPLIPVLATLILPVSSLLFTENRKAGRKEGEKPEYTIPFVKFVWFVVKFL